MIDEDAPLEGGLADYLVDLGAPRLETVGDLGEYVETLKKDVDLLSSIVARCVAKDLGLK